ncbi:hypothetical protein CEXT_25671 [Caerostris extrusa]|uniref:Uncharacterized protein n=1 Tax=Caerostris extrusa TaxID=172846 RepID=A0AAV4TUL7_CAEEX|nr:hypothetical protein CEXT_25671 [Caerostris extrusa]
MFNYVIRFSARSSLSDHFRHVSLTVDDAVSLSDSRAKRKIQIESLQGGYPLKALKGKGNPHCLADSREISGKSVETKVEQSGIFILTVSIPSQARLNPPFLPAVIDSSLRGEESIKKRLFKMFNRSEGEY